jgi:hypothetical protein
MADSANTELLFIPYPHPKDYLDFDFTEDRKKKVVDQARVNLISFSQERFPQYQERLTNLFNSVCNVFQNGGEIARIRFQKNALPTHSEYHIAKVLTLATQLFGKLKPKYQTEENALSLAIAAIVHDLGSLLKEDEDGIQEQVYSSHEERSIAMVDTIINNLDLPEGIKDNINRKVKFFILSTFVPLNMASKNQPEFSFASSFEETKLYQYIKTGQIDQQTLKAMGIESINEIGVKEINPEELEEFIELAKIFAAADHGSYLLEPCRIVEIMGLWKELQHVWEKDKQLSTRYKREKFFRQYLIGDFPESQIAIYGELLKKLGLNPFYDQPITVKQTFENINKLTERLSERPQHDALVRFEGFFSPTQLIELVNNLGLKLIELPAVKKAIIDYSSIFSEAKIHPPAEFTALATPALLEIYKATPDKTNFFIQAFTIIANQMKEELADDGTFNLHIAPFAYLSETENIQTFIENIRSAYRQVFLPQSKSDEKPPPKPTLYLTLREDKDDFNHLEELIAIITTPQTTPSEGVEFYLSFGGTNSSNFNFEKNLKDCLNNNINVVVHIGLQGEEEIRKRLNNILSILNDPQTPEDKKRKISVHIDDNFQAFLNWYDKLDNNGKNSVKQYLQISFSPLQYVLSNPKDNFDTIQKFTEAFPEAQIGTDNASQMGDIGPSVQHLLIPKK